MNAPSASAPAGPTVGAPHDDDVRTQQQVQAFRIHVVVFTGGIVMMFLVNLLTSLQGGITGQWSAWWSAWALIGWGTGIAVHGVVVWSTLSSRAMSHPPTNRASR
jgi:hypothetical protein